MLPSRRGQALLGKKAAFKLSYNRWQPQRAVQGAHGQQGLHQLKKTAVLARCLERNRWSPHAAVGVRLSKKETDWLACGLCCLEAGVASASSLSLRLTKQRPLFLPIS